MTLAQKLQAKNLPYFTVAVDLKIAHENEEIEDHKVAFAAGKVIYTLADGSKVAVDYINNKIIYSY